MTLCLVSTTTSGKFSLTKIEATVVSPAQIGFWKNLTLHDVSLNFMYTRIGQQRVQKVIFGASMSIQGSPDLRFALNYLGGPSFSFSDLPPSTSPKKPVEVTTVGGAAWSATASYHGEISILSALSHFAEVDLRKEFGQIGLTKLCEVMDLKLSESSITLSRSSKVTSFAFDSTVKHAFFDGPLHLEGRLAKSWNYRIKFDVSAGDLFTELGVGDIISLENMYLTFSNDGTSNKFVNTRHGKFTIEFAGTLAFKNACKSLADVTGTNAIAVGGAISNNSFSIYAQTKDLVLFDGMKLSGALAVKLASRTITVAIVGQLL